MALISNAWYAAAWADELGDALLPRTILNEPVLFFREASGRAVGILDVCPHRFAPLHLGTRIGDVIQCGYHGLEFDGTGSCVRNPQGNGTIPKAARVKSYPVVERYGLIWIWPGDPVNADQAAIPAYEHLIDPARRTVKGQNHLQCNYLLLVENLMDLGHFQYLHNAGHGPVSNFENVEINVSEEGQSVIDRRTYRAVNITGFWAARVADPSVPVDFWQDIRWNAVSSLRNHVGAAPVGHARTSGVDQMGTHLITPETEHSAHYFFANSRNHDLGESGDEGWRRWQRQALALEDKPMVEAIGGLSGVVDRLGMKPVLLQSDGAAVRVGRILERLERVESSAPEPHAVDRRERVGVTVQT